MEKDIGRIAKGVDTEIVVRIDDFGGKAGLTIREFVKSERYTGFTKSGTRIPAEKFKEFKEMIDSISENDFPSAAQPQAQAKLAPEKDKSQKKKALRKKLKKKMKKRPRKRK